MAPGPNIKIPKSSKPCPKCGGSIHVSAKFCIHCGADLTAEPTPQSANS
jgi:hypothetical protein